MDCGHQHEELQHFREGRHTYAEYRFFGSLPLTLCNFCSADFYSYDPAFFGLPSRPRIGDRHFEYLHELHPLPERTYDPVCPECERRLAFLQFLVAARELHTAANR